MFDNFSVNLRKNEGFLTYIPCIPIPEYGQSNAPLECKMAFSSFKIRKQASDREKLSEERTAYLASIAGH